jgi:hypothetical protein
MGASGVCPAGARSGNIGLLLVHAAKKLTVSIYNSEKNVEFVKKI